MASFRELFDEQERNEILQAMQRRRSDIANRLKTNRRGETARGVVTEEKLELQLDMIDSIIKTIHEECI